MEDNTVNRRTFVSNLALYGIGAGSLLVPQPGRAIPATDGGNINHIGPQAGYTPQIGTLISMLDWVSNSVIQYNKKLTVDQLDYLHDKESNTIGSLMLHLAATEVIYQDLTFHDLQDKRKPIELLQRRF
jgi:hypothetical protein